MKHITLPIFLLVSLLIAPALALSQAVTSRQSAVGPAQNINDPNDPLFKDEWALEHVGAICAWQQTIGSPDVTVAVVDSGVDMGHPDLVGRLRDDGRDFVDGDDDPSDENGHGTNVAGIVAATLDNNEGGAGLAPGVMILPVRVMNAKGFGSDRSIARGVRYAADQGAQVINLSLGATLTIGADTESAQVSAAIRYAQEKGALVIVAAGNDFVPLPNAIVGDNPDALIVAATDERDRKADFSNSGEWIGVAAPGVHILSAMPTYEVYLTSDAVPRDERFNQNYDYMRGTSQATPLVSGLAALLFSAHPDWNAGQVAQAIKDHAADISRQNRRLAAKGFLGSGRIDACAALSGQGTTPPAPDATDEAAPEATAPRSVEPEAPTRDAPANQPSNPPAVSAPRTNLLLPLAAGACGIVLLIGLVIIGLVRAGRRPRAAVAPAPAFPSSTPPARVPAVPPSPLPAGAWGALSVAGGPAGPARYPLAGVEVSIGRDSGCTIQILGDGTISRRHAIVRNDGRQITVADAGSTHGTYLNGQRLNGPVAVRRGMVLQVGQTLLRFE
jgi:type VII secretion-associated serine protease mycosin